MFKKDTELIKLECRHLERKLPVDVEDVFGILVHNLINHKGQRSKTTLVLSSVHKEGTTFISLNLARVLASIKRYSVLFIDLNLRSSAFTSLYSSKSFGLVDYFSDNALLDNIIKKTDIENLSFLPLGKAKSRSSMFLYTQKIPGMLEKLSEKFDFIIIDGAPVNPYSDSASIAAYVDAVLLVILAQKTRYEITQKAKETLENNQANILGTVINKRKYFIPRFFYKHL